LSFDYGKEAFIEIELFNLAIGRRSTMNEIFRYAANWDGFGQMELMVIEEVKDRTGCFVDVAEWNGTNMMR